MFKLPAYSCTPPPSACVCYWALTCHDQSLYIRVGGGGIWSLHHCGWAFWSVLLLAWGTRGCLSEIPFLGRGWPGQARDPQVPVTDARAGCCSYLTGGSAQQPAEVSQGSLRHYDPHPKSQPRTERLQRKTEEKHPILDKKKDHSYKYLLR